MGVAGVAVALLRLLREVGEDVESVNRRKGAGRGGGSITTPKRGVAIEPSGRWGHLNRPPKSITHYTKSNMEPYLETYRTINLFTDSTELQ